MSDYRIEVRVKNNNLLRKIAERGYSCVGEFCRLNNHMKWASKIGDFVNLKRSPLNFKGEFLPIVESMCDILQCSPEDLFSEVQLTTALESNKRTLEVNEAEMQFALDSTQEVRSLESTVHRDRIEGKVTELLETLTPKEAKTLSMRFGLGEYTHAHTLEEVAKAQDVTRERVRQIEQKALRKLRHPLRARVAIEYAE